MGILRLWPVAFCADVLDCNERRTRVDVAYNPRKYLLQVLRSTRRLRLPAVEAVFEREERLSDGVAERYSGGVDKGDGPYAPGLHREHISHAQEMTDNTVRH